MKIVLSSIFLGLSFFVTPDLKHSNVDFLKSNSLFLNSHIDPYSGTAQGENLFLFSSLHKYYISISNATYDEKSKSIQMVTRFFIDDFEDVLNARRSDSVELGDPAAIKELYPAIREYIDKKLTVQVDGANQIPSFLGAEYESDQIVLYIEIPADHSPKEVTMKFNALQELFEDQKNLVHFKINGVRRTLLNDKNKSIDTVKF